MTSKGETAITTACIKHIKNNGGDAWHVHGGMFQRSGEPDICGEIWLSNKAVHLKIEVKTQTGKPSALQKLRIKRYHEFGYGACFVRSVAELEAMLYTWMCNVEDHKETYDYNEITKKWLQPKNSTTTKSK